MPGSWSAISVRAPRPSSHDEACVSFDVYEAWTILTTSVSPSSSPSPSIRTSVVEVVTGVAVAGNSTVGLSAPSPVTVGRSAGRSAAGVPETPASAPIVSTMSTTNTSVAPGSMVEPSGGASA